MKKKTQTNRKKKGNTLDVSPIPFRKQTLRLSGVYCAIHMTNINIFTTGTHRKSTITEAIITRIVFKNEEKGSH